MLHTFTLATAGHASTTQAHATAAAGTRGESPAPAGLTQAELRQLILDTLG